MPEPLVLHKKDGFYELCLFENFGVRAAFTSRKFDMGFEQRVLKGSERLGRREAYLPLGINWKNLVCPSQVHGKKVFVAGKKEAGRGIFSRDDAVRDTDALITSVAHLPIGILTADCLPVFIFDKRLRVIALVHAGWRGLNSRLITETVRKMQQRFGCDPDSIIAVFGAAIRQCCYEVSEDFLKIFPKSVFKRGGKLYFDITKTAFEELTGLGVRLGNIQDSRICTSCMNNEFFSFRREGENVGRSMSVMELKK